MYAQRFAHGANVARSAEEVRIGQELVIDLRVNHLYHQLVQPLGDRIELLGAHVLNDGDVDEGREELGALERLLLVRLGVNLAPGCRSRLGGGLGHVTRLGVDGDEDAVEVGLLAELAAPIRKAKIVDKSAPAKAVPPRARKRGG